MSLEEALTANTAALEALTAIIVGKLDGKLEETTTSPEVGDKPEKKPAPKTETKQQATSSISETTSQESAPVSYDEVKKLILQISKADRNKAVALLARFGAKGGTELKPDQYPKFVIDAQRVVDGEYDPEASDAG